MIASKFALFLALAMAMAVMTTTTTTTTTMMANVGRNKFALGLDAPQYDQSARSLAVSSEQQTISSAVSPTTYDDAAVATPATCEQETDDGAQVNKCHYEKDITTTG
ncbi:hypothetical protein THAOC_00511, partial [Thalassiosira oceanica]